MVKGEDCQLVAAQGKRALCPSLRRWSERGEGVDLVHVPLSLYWPYFSIVASHTIRPREKCTFSA